jgi:hypothetical protein
MGYIQHDADTTPTMDVDAQKIRQANRDKTDRKQLRDGAMRGITQIAGVIGGLLTSPASVTPYINSATKASHNGVDGRVTSYITSATMAIRNGVNDRVSTLSMGFTTPPSATSAPVDDFASDSIGEDSDDEDTVPAVSLPAVSAQKIRQANRAKTELKNRRDSTMSGITHITGVIGGLLTSPASVTPYVNDRVSTLSMGFTTPPSATSAPVDDFASDSIGEDSDDEDPVPAVSLPAVSRSTGARRVLFEDTASDPDEELFDTSEYPAEDAPTKVAIVPSVSVQATPQVVVNTSTVVVAVAFITIINSMISVCLCVWLFSPRIVSLIH